MNCIAVLRLHAYETNGIVGSGDVEGWVAECLDTRHALKAMGSVGSILRLAVEGYQQKETSAKLHISEYRCRKVWRKYGIPGRRKR